MFLTRYLKWLTIASVKFYKRYRFIIFYKINFILLKKYSEKIPTRLFKDKKILVITAHPDDEIFCLAHFIKEIQKVTKYITWVNTTLGQNSINSELFETKEITAEIRELEFKNSLNYLRIKHYKNLALPSYLTSEIEPVLLNSINDWIKECDFLFVIGKNDKHPDHYFSTLTFEKYKNSNQVFYYNVQKVKFSRKSNYFSIDFNEKLFDDLLKIYNSQSHMENSFSAYRKVFKHKVFIYNENIN